jgi:phosphohistidine phosphatase
MNLYILRHASAGTRRINPLLDLKRPLDKDGKRHCLHLGMILNAMKLNFDLIVSSPLKRSLQTAQLIGTETGYESRILISNALAPTAKLPQFQRLLRECAQYENLLVVGHNPNITTFLGALIGANANPADDVDRARVRLRKGSLARLSMQRGPATLQWLLEPRTVRALYTTSTKSSLRKTSRK